MGAGLHERNRRKKNRNTHTLNNPAKKDCFFRFYFDVFLRGITTQDEKRKKKSFGWENTYVKVKFRSRVLVLHSRIRKSRDKYTSKSGCVDPTYERLKRINDCGARFNAQTVIYCVSNK